MVVAENRLIALLPHRDQMRLLAISESVHLDLGTVLCEPGEPTRHVYFPNDCSISLVTTINRRITKIHTSSWTCTVGSFTASRMNEISATPVTP